MTQFAWQWGQFVDHDVTLVSEDHSTWDENQKMNIYIPCGDQEFDSEYECNAEHVMPAFRSRAYNDSGTSLNNPRYQQNDITSWIAGSMIYGSSDQTSNLLRYNIYSFFSIVWLCVCAFIILFGVITRSFENGKLRVTETEFGDLLPMDDNGHFIAGDVRVNEITSLIMMHTIFVRLHNLIAEDIYDTTLASTPGLSDDEMDELLYQYTRSLVAAIIQKITYKDWLPTLFGEAAIDEYLGPYAGYNSEINTDICTVFSTAAFRFGHTMATERLPLRRDNCANFKDEVLQDLELREAFFQPQLWLENEDLMELLVNGFSCTLSNEVDTRMVNAIRNFLFETIGDPLDLFSLNIQRGRDHGLADYNSVRGYFGLTKFQSYNDSRIDFFEGPEFERILSTLSKNDINNIDLFIGLLAESHLEGGSFGELISKIVLQQFGDLRDGDRFWYENYFQTDLIEFIEKMTLVDVIEAVTNLDGLQTLDDERNIFQNTNARSIFDGYPSRSSLAKAKTSESEDSNYDLGNNQMNVEHLDTDNDGNPDLVQFNFRFNSLEGKKDTLDTREYY